MPDPYWVKIGEQIAERRRRAYRAKALTFTNAPGMNDWTYDVMPVTPLCRICRKQDSFGSHSEAELERGWFKWGTSWYCPKHATRCTAHIRYRGKVRVSHV